MKLGINSLFLTLPVAFIANTVNISAKFEQKTVQNSKSTTRLRSIRDNLLWYVEKHGYGWFPIYSIDFTRKFFVNAIEFLEQMSLEFNFRKSVDEKIYNQVSGGKFLEHKKEIGSELSKVSLMSYNIYGGIAITGPACIILKNSFWNSWDLVFNNMVKTFNLQSNLYI